MKISQITKNTIKDYCGISGEDSDSLIDVMSDACKAFIRGYTGLSDEELDLHEDITVAYLVIINDMYSVRDYVADKSNLNPTAAQILYQYSVNFV